MFAYKAHHLCEQLKREFTRSGTFLPIELKCELKYYLYVAVNNLQQLLTGPLVFLDGNEL